MKSDIIYEECDFCGNQFCSESCEPGELSICEQCLMGELPVLLAQYALNRQDGDCSFRKLNDTMKAFECQFWKVSAALLHGAVDAQEEDEFDNCLEPHG